jgi:hypothetical protein
MRFGAIVRDAIASWEASSRSQNLAKSTFYRGPFHSTLAHHIHTPPSNQDSTSLYLHLTSLSQLHPFTSRSTFHSKLHHPTYPDTPTLHNSTSKHTLRTDPHPSSSKSTTLPIDLYQSTHVWSIHTHHPAILNSITGLHKFPNMIQKDKYTNNHNSPNAISTPTNRTHQVHLDSET